MTSFLKLTDEAILETPFDSLRLSPRNVFHPTSASIKLPDGTVFGKCIRQAYYEKVMPEAAAQFSTKALRIFDFGNIFEQHEIELYKRLGVFVSDHVKIGFEIADVPGYGKFLLTGEADVIVKDPETGNYVGIELKTGYGDGFLRQHISGYTSKYSKPLKYLATLEGSAPKIEHILQAALYLYFFTEIHPELGIKEWRLIYMARDKLIGAEYRMTLEVDRGLHKIKIEKVYESTKGLINEPVPLVTMYVEWILDRFVTLAHYVATNSLPPRDYTPTSEDAYLVKAHLREGLISKSRYEYLLKHPEKALDWQCEYCLFRETCLKDG